MKQYRWLILASIAALAFAATCRQDWRTRSIVFAPQLNDRVVISAPMQIFMYGGDRYLAADLETIRLASLATVELDQDTANYLSRAHRLVAELNPCHEDNYYLGNVLLSWAGAEEQGDKLLLQATECRHWDWVPPFFYAINQYFFKHNGSEAQKAMDIAAERSPNNYASLKKNGIMMAAQQIDDQALAINYLKQQRDQATDKKLRLLLQKRITRLEGLMTLRNAQQRYEKQSGHRLTDPQALLSGGYLEQFPEDPVGRGYIFEDGHFQLRKLKIAGME